MQQRRYPNRLTVIVEPPSFFEWPGWRMFWQILVTSAIIGWLAFIAGLWAGH